MAKKYKTHYDDGGNVDLSPIDTTATYMPDNSGAPSSADISALTSGDTSGANSIQAQVGSNPLAAATNPTDTGSSGGALKGALSFLGSKQGTDVLKALTGILGAAGGMQQRKAYATLPGMPQLPGMPGMANSGTSSGSYGPPGGYNWQNYKGITGATPGTGYAPRTQAAAQTPASYYTYGQGPEQQFFQQVNPQGGPIAPVTHKSGGHISKFAMGGMVPNAAAPMMQNNALGGMRPPAMNPMMPQAAPNMQAPMQRPGMPGARPFAAGGDAQGALSHPTQGSRYVRGPGDGTSDDIPARLANGEYVLSADVVSGLGNGDNNSGAKVLDGFVHSLRTHKAENASKGKLPADAKPINHYMKGGR